MDRNIVNNIKTLGIDMIANANSGHPGIVLGAAPIIYTLYAKNMNINPLDPYWENRDRFVMSAGHGSALLYATLFMAGYDISLDDLKDFRKIHSKTPGHPEFGVTPGVDMSTGPLGQGIASAVGMAIMAKKNNLKFQKPKKSKLAKSESLFDYNVFTLCGDGDLMEGVSYEALSLAGSLKLNNLIVLYDSNSITLDGKTNNVFDDDILKRFEAMNFSTFLVKDGNSISAIDKAIKEALKSDKPSLIQIKTIIGADSIYEGTNKVHGSPLEESDITRVKNTLGIQNEPFYFDEKYKVEFMNQIKNRTSKYEKFKSENFKKEEFNLDLSALEIDGNLSLREVNGLVLNEIHKQIPEFIGGSADVGSSTKVNTVDTINNDFNNSVINFGVREHAMGAILNGIALDGINCYGSTFLAFSDYLKPAIRMSSLIKLPVTHVFTHDSIMIGPDGPTHQPIEHINMLRSIPGFNVFRPCDKNEIKACWEQIIKFKLPSAVILSRDRVLEMPTSMVGAKKGGYILRKEANKLHAIIIATGSEVSLAYKLALDLFTMGIDIRVVSMPNRELFLRQDVTYKEEVLPKMSRNIVIEFGNKYGWESFVYGEKYLITLDKFGYSGSKDEILSELSLDYDSVKQKVLNMLK